MDYATYLRLSPPMKTVESVTLLAGHSERYPQKNFAFFRMFVTKYYATVLYSQESQKRGLYKAPNKVPGIGCSGLTANGNSRQYPNQLKLADTLRVEDHRSWRMYLKRLDPKWQ